jgi:CheY-like chemotaxis protein
MTKTKSSGRKTPATQLLRRKPGILLVEDDDANASTVIKGLSSWGFEVHHARTVQEGLGIAKEFPTLRFVGLDMDVPNAERGADRRLSGLVLLRELNAILPKAKFYMKSSNAFGSEAEKFIRVYKKSVVRAGLGWDSELMAEKAKIVYSDGRMRPTIFVVHGHAADALDQLKLLITKDLRLGEPVIMKDAPEGLGYVIIEKFEEYAARADLVFALLTPDDETEEGLRARQNVIFEIGYFAAALGRKSGKLIVLHHRKVQKPSDMDGLLTIDITGGVRQAAGKIREELKGWWGTTE